jgi:hypothetical protein
VVVLGEGVGDVVKVLRGVRVKVKRRDAKRDLSTGGARGGRRSA